ncbi:MAG TPA: short-chain dehydrogenase, partial [Pseudomonas sp.]|nr:short-chain dehydrogenase [Pseudomonas sp.]
MSKTNLFDLDGKIAFVSGASRGIGEAIAKLLAQQGAHVIVSSRKIDGCQAVADAINADGGKATAVACHIGELEQIQAVFAQIREQFGRLDILVNN